MTHSLGLLRALCLEFKDVKIIAIDPPDMSLENITQKYDTMEDDLKTFCYAKN